MNHWGEFPEDTLPDKILSYYFDGFWSDCADAFRFTCRRLFSFEAVT